MALETYSLLREIQNHDAISGAALGERFGVSRAAISKRLKELDELVETFPSKGYALRSGYQLLRQEAVIALQHHHPEWLVDTRLEVDSTNSILVAEARAGDARPKILLAERQTAGRGRRGRAWQQPIGTGLSFSLRWQFEAGFNVLSGLSLAVGVWVAEVLQQFGFDTQLKWPNDLYFNQAKLGGVLVEVDGDVDGPVTVVVGVGINLLKVPNVDQRVTHLNCYEKDELFVALSNRLIRGLMNYEETGFGSLKDSWMSRALWMNESVTVSSVSNQQQGTLKGVDSDGSLIVAVGGELVHFSGGELSLRGAS